MKNEGYLAGPPFFLIKVHFEEQKNAEIFPRFEKEDTIPAFYFCKAKKIKKKFVF